MKYPNIAKSLGWQEVADIQEGIFLQPVEAAKIEKDLGQGTTGKSSSVDIAIRDKRIKELEGQIAALSKQKANVVNGKQVDPIDYSFIDNVCAARKRRLENT